MRQKLVILAAIVSTMTIAPQVCAAALVNPTAATVTSTDRSASGNVLRFAQVRITPSQAKAIALSRVPGGEVVDIRRSGDFYRVRVIARDGRVVDIVIDANTGRVR